MEQRIITAAAVVGALALVWMAWNSPGPYMPCGDFCAQDSRTGVMYITKSPNEFVRIDPIE